MAASAASAAPDTYARLMRRNNRVALLRWLVPLVGVVLALVVGVGIALDALSSSFGFAKLRIDRDRMIVDTPELSSTMSDGTVLTLSAGAASAALAQTDQIALTTAKLTMRGTDVPALTAEAAEAAIDTTAQNVLVPGVTRFTNTDGMTGEADGLNADFASGTATSGAVDLSLRDGSRLVADEMSYDNATRTWVFHKVKVTVPFTPGAAP